MVLIGLTDIHGKADNISKIAKILTQADAIVISGDITHFGSEKEAVKVLEYIKKYNSKIFAVAGNCDYPGVEKYLTESGYNLNGLSKSLDGFTLIGLGGSLPCPGRTPNEYTEDELEAILEGSVTEIKDKTSLILVSHQPPYNTVSDEVRTGLHVGSQAVRSFIEKYQPIVCFTGHIHEGVGTDTIGKTRLANPGPLWYGRYTYAEISEGLTAKLEIYRV